MRKKSETIYHPVGTCKMARPKDPTPVVDENLHVKGIRVRVVTPLVMPRP